jgi:hypothetical protein
MMNKKASHMLDRFNETQEKIERFGDLLDSIESTKDKKKMLWKEVYENALTDRENANVLFTEAYKQMQGGSYEHATLGPVMTKYLERMCKSNEQMLRLAELIAKEEERAAKIDPDDIFSQIKEEK